MSGLMKSKILIDGRNQFSSKQINKHGFEYYQIGVSNLMKFRKALKSDSVKDF